MYRPNGDKLIYPLGKGNGNNGKISSGDNGVGAPAVVEPAPVTVSAVERGSSEIRERPRLAGTSEASGNSGNVLEGDLTQLVEKLHRLEARKLRQFVEDLQTAFQEVALEPSDHLGTDGATSPVTSAAVSSSPDVIEHAVEYPSIIETTAPTSIPDARPSSARSRAQWSKRTGLFLALSAVTALIPWEWPVLFESLPQATPIIRESAVEQSTPDPSARDQVMKEIAPIDGTVAPAAPAPSPSVATNDIEVLIDRGDQLLGRGDVSAARSYYERAAASGSSRAAIGVARTFDPLFLTQLGVVGVRGDPERAATWYRNASQAAGREEDPHLSARPSK